MMRMKTGEQGVCLFWCPICERVGSGPLPAPRSEAAEEPTCPQSCWRRGHSHVPLISLFPSWSQQGASERLRTFLSPAAGDPVYHFTHIMVSVPGSIRHLHTVVAVITGFFFLRCTKSRICSKEVFCLFYFEVFLWCSEGFTVCGGSGLKWGCGCARTGACPEPTCGCRWPPQTTAAAAVCVPERCRRWKKVHILRCTQVRKKRCSRKGDVGAEKLNVWFLMTSAGGLGSSLIKRWKDGQRYWSIWFSKNQQLNYGILHQAKIQKASF